MLTNILQSLLSKAITGDGKAFQQYIVQQRDSNISFLIEERLTHCKQAYLDLVNYVLENPHPEFKLSKCSTLLLDHVVDALAEINSNEMSERFEGLLQEAISQASSTSDANKAGLAFAHLKLDHKIFKKKSPPDFVRALFRCSDDNEGVVEVLKAAYCRFKVETQERANEFIARAVQKGNARAMYLKVDPEFRTFLRFAGYTNTTVRQKVHAELFQAASLGCDASACALAYFHYHQANASYNSLVELQNHLSETHRYFLDAISQGNTVAASKFADLLLSDVNFANLHRERTGRKISDEVKLLLKLNKDTASHTAIERKRKNEQNLDQRNEMDVKRRGTSSHGVILNSLTDAHFAPVNDLAEALFEHAVRRTTVISVKEEDLTGVKTSTTLADLDKEITKLSSLAFKPVGMQTTVKDSGVHGMFGKKNGELLNNSPQNTTTDLNNAEVFTFDL